MQWALLSCAAALAAWLWLVARAMLPLQKRMRRADRVHLKSPGTDLTFSIKGIGAELCQGTRNIPDGEVFSCPVKTSVNGVIQFNTPTIYSGTKFENVRLEFKEGKVVKATSNNTKRLNEILDTDSICARIQGLWATP